jgi:signal transduction histidine kinase
MILGEAEAVLTQLSRLTLPAPALGWSKRFGGVIAEMTPRIERLAGYRVEIDDKVRKFVELRRQLDDILDVGIQVDSNKDLAAARTTQNDAVYAISRQTLALGFAAIVLAALAVIALSRTLIRPLGELSGAAEKLSDGEFSARVAVAGKDEIAVLGTVFNNMAAAVQRNQAALRDANRGLEEKVAQRTRDIEEANRRLLKELEERTRVEEELRQAMSTAQAASKAKSGFLANMSHELRTPLNAVIGFAEVISQELHGKVDNPRYLEYAQYIHQSGNHLLRLINDILDLSRIESGRIDMAEETVDVAALVDEVVNLLRQQAAAAGIEIETAIPGNLPGLHADGGRLRQILVNLVANAIKFTKSGGRVSVGAGLGPTPEKRYEITVADTGIGIPEDKIELALSSFGRVDNGLLREGTGLGLPLTKKLAEMHGGGLDLVSQVGKGTTVTVWMPGSRAVDAPKVKKAKQPVIA